MKGNTKMFNQYNLPEFLQEALNNIGFNEPTPIQKQAIPIILEGQDILASAHTGTGKTGAFLIPLLSKLDFNDAKTSQILVLAPTRELAAQVNKAARDLLAGSPFKTAILIGGEDMRPQLMSLKKGAAVIIATPGRMLDHLKRNTANIDQIKTLVLDETDRMLDMGFGVQIDEIMEYMPDQRQNLMFSATLPSAIIKLSAKYLKNPQRIAADAVNTVTDNITQETIETKHKKTSLIDLVCESEETTLIFVNTREYAEEIKEELEEMGVEAACLHGGLRQEKRTRIIKGFRNNRTRVLVATDVAARGLDIPHLDLVINYDLPINPEDYIHRIGRTGRAEKSGRAITLLTSKDKGRWHIIQDFLNGKDPKIEARRSQSAGAGSGRRFGNRSESYSGNRSGSRSGNREGNGGGWKKQSSFGKKKRY